ncbi:MAG: hypothetical protein LBO05_04865 [Deltaproteobacteria bacterium]|jgi:hypothetical protein|nr:hypothetical protein [Deltaproteobacteria bacterium]
MREKKPSDNLRAAAVPTSGRKKRPDRLEGVASTPRGLVNSSDGIVSRQDGLANHRDGVMSSGTPPKEISLPAAGGGRGGTAFRARPALWVSAALMTPGRAMAVGLGGLGQNVANNLSGLAKAVQMFGFVAGFTLVVMGLLELYNSGKSHDATLKGGITKCVVGASLLAIDAIISSFSTTIFGGDESGTGLGGLGL